jgi:hypothetical protein
MFRAFRFLWLLLLFAPVGVAQAQDEQAPAAPAAPATPPAVAPAPVPDTLEQKSTMTGGQMMDQGREYRRQMEAIAIQIQVQAEQAKAEKDVIRLNCLLDKLTQVKVNGNIMDQALQALQDDVSRNDESGELHEYTRITIINQKAQVLRTEADACVGAETTYVGRTKLVVESPAGLDSTADQPAPAATPITVVDRPPVASPYQQ